jgi:hypothetical protein
LTEKKKKKWRKRVRKRVTELEPGVKENWKYKSTHCREVRIMKNVTKDELEKKEKFKKQRTQSMLNRKGCESNRRKKN